MVVCVRAYWSALFEDADLPAARAPGVHVHEIGCLVEADAATPHGERRIPQFPGRNTLETHIDGLAEQMLAVLRNAGILVATAEHLVRLWRAIGRHHLVGALAAERGSHVVNQIEQLRIHFGRVTGPEVEEKTIDFVERRRDVGAIAGIHDIQPLPGVRMIERQFALGILELALAYARQGREDQRDKGRYRRRRFTQVVHGGIECNKNNKYDVFFRNFKVRRHMFRVSAAIAVGLLLVSLPAAAPARADEPDNITDSVAVRGGAVRGEVLRLQSELQRHRKLAASGGWPPVPDGPTIHPGAGDSRLAVLARRLALSGDLRDENTQRSYYDAGLQDAVQAFQARHGLTADGLVGRATLRALNVSSEQRVDQIRVNLERRRLVSEVDDESLVLVNIPAFEARLIGGGRTVWKTRIVVGDPKDRTPELRSELRSVVFNPTWSVPHSIASEELLPQIKQDPDFFRKGSYELHDRDGNRVDPSAVDWRRIGRSNFSFRLLQRPGPANQLGKIKFLVPNPYSVCIHDTPAKTLFSNANRALSHGCIRIDDPLYFAALVLADEGWTRADVDAQIDSGRTRTVSLAKPLPVYVVYWTAEVDDQGRIRFYDDIYGLDAEILGALDTAGRKDQHDRPANQNK